MAEFRLIKRLTVEFDEQLNVKGNINIGTVTQTSDQTVYLTVKVPKVDSMYDSAYIACELPSTIPEVEKKIKVPRAFYEPFTFAETIDGVDYYTAHFCLDDVVLRYPGNVNINLVIKHRTGNIITDDENDYELSEVITLTSSSFILTVLKTSNYSENLYPEDEDQYEEAVERIDKIMDSIQTIVSGQVIKKDVLLVFNTLPSDLNPYIGMILLLKDTYQFIYVNENGEGITIMDADEIVETIEPLKTSTPASTEGLKTINGESLVGEGDISTKALRKVDYIKKFHGINYALDIFTEDWSNIATIPIISFSNPVKLQWSKKLWYKSKKYTGMEKDCPYATFGDYAGNNGYFENLTILDFFKIIGLNRIEEDGLDFSLDRTSEIKGQINLQLEKDAFVLDRDGNETAPPLQNEGLAFIGNKMHLRFYFCSSYNFYNFFYDFVQKECDLSEPNDYRSISKNVAYSLKRDFLIRTFGTNVEGSTASFNPDHLEADIARCRWQSLYLKPKKIIEGKEILGTHGICLQWIFLPADGLGTEPVLGQCNDTDSAWDNSYVMLALKWFKYKIK